MFDMFYVRQNFSQTDLDLPNMSPLLNSDRSAMTVVVFNSWCSMTTLKNRQTNKKPKRKVNNRF